MSAFHHPDHEHNFEVALPAVVPDVDIDAAPHSPNPGRRSLGARLHHSSSTLTVNRTDLEKGKENSDVVDWEDDDPENPRNFSKAKKWYITLTVSALCLAVALGSAIITGDLSGPAEELGMSEIVGNLAVTLFVVGFGVGPLVYAPMSEMFGRRPIYIISMGLYTVFTIPSAVAKNSATLLVGRALAGLAASAPMTNVGGSVADVWNLEERGTPMALFSAVIFIGPILGPVIGGFIGETVGWRWIYYVLLIFVGIRWGLTFTIPETFAVVLLRRRAEKLRRETSNANIRTASEIAEEGVTMSTRIRLALIRPFEMLMTEPILIFMSLYLSLVYMLLYLFFFAFPIVFEGLHHFDAGQTGLTFLSILVGIFFSILSMRYWNGLYKRLYPEHGPEARLPPMMTGCLLLPVSLFIFAWTSYENVSWVGPMLSGVPFGSAMVLIYISANSYIIDSFPKYVASAVAAKTFLRSMAGASVPMFVVQMYDGMNPRWASTLLALVSTGMMAIPFVFFKWGSRIRASSKRAND